jgi:hypothetical protein
VTATATSRGKELADRLAQGVQDVARAPLPGARKLPVLMTVNPRGEAIGLFENGLTEAADILVASNRVFTLGDGVVQEVGQPGEGMDCHRLVPLRTGYRIEPGAEDWLANVFVCWHKAKQFAPPKPFTDVLLRSEPTLVRLPRIRTYARRPVFDDDFVLRGPGWHAGPGILVHGPDVEPIALEPGDATLPALDRLPPHLRTLLGGFCFAGDADLVNAAALLLTGLLLHHFLTDPKPVGVLDGNQAGVGKTLLARAIGMVLGGTDPRLIHYTADDEELQKRLCAVLRESQQAVLVIDNAKVRGGGIIESAAIEANSMAPAISLRILGRSENYTRPNDVLWLLTMNCTRASSDLVSRGLPIRLAYEGDPRDRAFSGPEPVAYARDHQLKILGELAGMVINWTQLGRPPGSQGHRCDRWARLVGGILEAAGYPEFLANYGEAAAAFSSEMDELAALAEKAVAAGGDGQGFCVIDKGG